jgi:hypothetical protein
MGYECRAASEEAVETFGEIVPSSTGRLSICQKNSRRLNAFRPTNGSSGHDAKGLGPP